MLQSSVCTPSHHRHARGVVKTIAKSLIIITVVALLGLCVIAWFSGREGDLVLTPNESTAASPDSRNSEDAEKGEQKAPINALELERPPFLKEGK